MRIRNKTVDETFDRCYDCPYFVLNEWIGESRESHQCSYGGILSAIFDCEEIPRLCPLPDTFDEVKSDDKEKGSCAGCVHYCSDCPETKPQPEYISEEDRIKHKFRDALEYPGISVHEDVVERIYDVFLEETKEVVQNALDNMKDIIDDKFNELDEQYYNLTNNLDDIINDNL